MYVFTSYANFCDDYLLRINKYKVFCEIAYKRLIKLDMDDLSFRDKRQSQIIMDTYAKSISLENNSLFDAIYQKILPEANPHTQIYLRLRLRWIELKVKRLIYSRTDSDYTKFDVVYKELKSFFLDFISLKKQII